MSNEIKQIFIDGIDNINFINGMVRMSIGTIIPNNMNTGEIEDNLEFKPEYRLIMPLNSFLSAFKSQQGLIDKLIENKIITKEQDTTE